MYHAVRYGATALLMACALWAGSGAALPAAAEEAGEVNRTLLAAAKDSDRASVIAALDRGAVREVVDEGITGMIFDNLEQMTHDLPRVFDLDRRRVRERAVQRFGVARMVDEYIGVYARIVEQHRGR